MLVTFGRFIAVDCYQLIFLHWHRFFILFFCFFFIWKINIEEIHSLICVRVYCCIFMKVNESIVSYLNNYCDPVNVFLSFWRVIHFVCVNIENLFPLPYYYTCFVTHKEHTYAIFRVLTQQDRKKKTKYVHLTMTFLWREEFMLFFFG